jgi:hypothetical protein
MHGQENYHCKPDSELAKTVAGEDSVDELVRTFNLQHTAIEVPSKLAESATETLHEIEALCNKALSNAAYHDKYVTHLKLNLLKSKLRVVLQGVDRDAPRSIIDRLISANKQISNQGEMPK